MTAVAPPPKSSLDFLVQLAPVLAGLPLLFYIGGTLLSLGFFFTIGLTALTAFSPTEIAMAGWLRIAAGSFIVFPALAIASVVAWPTSSAVADKLMDRRPQATSVALCIIVALGCIFGTIYARGVLQGLLSAVAATMFGVFAIAFAMKREEAMQARFRLWRWWLLTFFVALAFTALGEATFSEATQFERGGIVRLTLPEGAVCVRPLLFGSERLVYERNGLFILSSYDGKVVAVIGHRERSDLRTSASSKTC